MALLLTTSAYSQSKISGIVKNVESGSVLVGAAIIVDEINEGGVTDDDGTFTFMTQKKFPLSITVSYLGFEDQNIVVQNSDYLSIALQPKSYLGETVVVSASRKKEKSSEAAASVSVIEARKIETKALTHPALHLQQIPGAAVSIQGTDNFQITLRGKNEVFTTETFILQDYRTLVSPALGISILSRTTLLDLDLERVEVVRGPGSALYGPGVEAGVVHFLTKSARKYPGTSVNLIGGTQNTIGASLRHAAIVSDNLSYKLVAQYQQSTDFKLDPSNPVDSASISQFVPDIRSSRTGEIIYPGITQLEPDNKRYSFAGTLEYQLTDTRQLTFTSGYAYRKGVVRAALGEALQDHPDYYSQLRYTSNDFFAQAFVNVLDNDNEKGFLYRTGLTNVNKNSSYHLQTQKRFRELTQKLDLTLGAEAQWGRSVTEGTVHGRYEDEDDFDIYSLYTQADYKLAEPLQIVLAGRLDRFQALTTTSFSPRAALIYKPTPTNTFRLSYNRAVSSPQALFLFSDIPFGSSPAFDIPLIGGIEPIEFDDNLVTESFIPGVGSYPGLDLPLSIPYAIAAQGLEGVFSPEVLDYLFSKIPLVSSSSGGVTLLNNQVSNKLPERGTINPSVTNAYELSYKGVIGNRFSLGLDLYYNKRKDLVFVSQTSPLVLYPGLSADLAAEVIRVTDPQELEALGISQEAVVGAFSAVAENLAANPLGLVEPNIAADGALPQFVFSFYNSGSIDYFGADLSLGYYYNDDIYLYSNISWLSKNLWNDEEIGQAGTGQRYGLNVADKRLNIGFDYIPESGLHFGASFIYQSEVEIENGTIFSGLLEDYGMLNLNIGYAFNDQIRITVSAQNALDNKYRIMPNMPQIGRMVLAKFNYSL